ncbi:winged helix-turn-helix domain-containing protein [Candidatus Palauibacter sp.]|uniref:winged helix-turn-helix domain-containing protein n=1 Tax=Candidatus Palauibacter sp. TaxID=3101350 RepID=UPI003AF29018
MAEQAITQEQLFLPLLHFMADHGGEIDRQKDDLLNALADRLGLTDEERDRTTEGGRNQWQSTVEYSRFKLLAVYDAIDEDSPHGTWRLTDRGWTIVKSPPAEMEEYFREWWEQRETERPADTLPPPSRPSGLPSARLENMTQGLIREVTEELRVKRNGELARALREEYGYRCQLCDLEDPECPRIPMADGRYYVEAHHLGGLAEVVARYEHGQLSDSEYANLTSWHNIVVVCPYHHMLIHHHDPTIEFVQEELVFRTADGTTELPIVRRLPSHLKPVDNNGEDT